MSGTVIWPPPQPGRHPEHRASASTQQQCGASLPRLPDGSPVVRHSGLDDGVALAIDRFRLRVGLPPLPPDLLGRAGPEPGKPGAGTVT